jgi:dimethylargininase
LTAALVAPPSPAIAHAVPLHGESHAIAERASEQHAIFVGRLRAYGVAVTTLEGTSAHPLDSLAADLAVVFRDGAFVMRPSDLERRRSVAVVEAALQAAGVPIVGRIESPGLLDGGDVVRIGDTLFVGVPVARASDVGIHARSHGNALGREQLATYARANGLDVVDVEMSAECRRLRSVVAPLDTASVIVAGSLVDARAFAKYEIVSVPQGEDYGGGVLAVGGRTVIANLRFAETYKALRRAKVTVDAIDLGEFGKGGTTPSLLALALKRT